MSIEGDDGNDVIYNNAEEVMIQGGAGEDFITNNGGSLISINAGKGDDSIYLERVGKLKIIM